ncbi:lactate permease LctP family transporter [Snodgrassella sp. ESL0253]|uniref:lactate permease LctP family transporter n=1 Tax=Snodgrassella sp. ESL0253 TaxID=2705031 RepID=UPI001581DE2B|nr:lactate permease LctP family transporter [Snodgrassella sp. ESL0253]NUE67379.1 L-lactate permease [Snodgrassella sp. ESL0253]
MHTWVQSYSALGNSIYLTLLAALLPIIFFFVALTVLRMKGHIAGAITLILAIIVAVTAYKMPLTLALSSALYGFFYGLWPIAWIIITAVFLYNLTVKSGQFDIIRASILSITEDQRLQLLLIGFCFGSFLEGAAGFGAPVAISAALLVGLGFKPLYAAGLCLIADTAPVAFGALGIPILVGGQVSGLDPFHIGQLAGRQLPMMSIVIPFYLIFIMDGMRGIRQTWPALLVSGVSFATTQFITANFIGPELPDVTSALVSLVCLALFLQKWQPKQIFTFGGMQQPSKQSKPKEYNIRQIAQAWSPFVILTICVAVWTIKPLQAWFNSFSLIKIHWPMLDNLVIKTTPIVAENTPIAAEFKLNLIGAVGTSILLAAIISVLILKIKPRLAVDTFKHTLYDLRYPILSIGLVLAFAYVVNYSGLSSTLALALADTGKAFPFFSPFLGWVGVFLTGSDTSANALFGALQANTAMQVGMDPVLAVAANSVGGVTGKMISPQSIAIACAAVGLAGKESDLFRFTVRHSLFFCVIAGLFTFVQTYLFPWTLTLF